jgi:hypothetical protein
MNQHDTGRFAVLRDWKKLAALSFILLGGPGFFLPSVQALTGTINSNAADGQANSDGTVTATTATFGRIGADAGIQHSVIHVFQIPSAVLADPTQQFSAATYTVKTSVPSGGMTTNDDLYGLGYSTSPTISPADFYAGSLDTTSVLLKDNFITPATPSYAAVSESGTALVNHLNDCLAAARLAGAPNAYVFIRNSLDAVTYWSLYQVGLSEAGGAYMPTLSYTTVTVPVWNTVPLGGRRFCHGTGEQCRWQRLLLPHGCGRGVPMGADWRRRGQRLLGFAQRCDRSFWHGRGQRDDGCRVDRDRPQQPQPGLHGGGQRDLYFR